MLQTLNRKLAEHLSVLDFGAVGDGVADDTAAIQAAINAFPTGCGTITFPAGQYKVTSKITVAQDRIHLIGMGMHATKINFEPTANATCFEFKKADASVIYQGSVRDMAFASLDATYEKIAINVVDGSGYAVENIASYPWTGGAGGSVAVQINGREFGLYRNLYLSADKPIIIGTNPNSAGISIDHHHFQDLFLAGPESDTFPLVTIADGVVLTQVTFDGAQAWVNGSHGLYWNYTGATISNGLSLNNIRWEGQGSAAGYLVYLNRTAVALQNVTVRNCYGGSSTNGFYLRLIDKITFENTYYVSLTLKALDVNSSVYGMSFANCLWQAGSTVSITGQRLIEGLPYASGPTYSTARWESTAVTQKEPATACPLPAASVTLADDGVCDLTPYLSSGLLFITDNHETAAIIRLNGSVHTTAIINDGGGQYTVTPANDTTANVYWSAGNARYELENKFGSSVTFKLAMMGS
jgi:hypothetical protein